MKYIFALTFLVLLPVLSHGEQVSFAPQPIPQPTTPIVVDEFSDLSSKDQKARLKLAAKKMKDYKNRVGDMGVPIVVYGEECSALRWVNRVKSYLVRIEGIESNKIFPVYGGDGPIRRIVIYLLPERPFDVEAEFGLGKIPDCGVKRKTQRRVSRRGRLVDRR